MLKTEQILNAKFTPVSKGTYSAEEVDAFIKAVAQSYDQLTNEKNELIKKISILADKIESYRNDEEAIKLSLLDAHRMAETISKNATIKSDTLIGDAETRAQLIVDGANRQANKTIEEAKEQAKGIVENAKDTVASLTERAQKETDEAIATARAKAAVIVSDAKDEAERIVSASKDAYEFYTAELKRIQTVTSEFKATVKVLCNNQLAVVESIPDTITIPLAYESSEIVQENDEAEVEEEIEITIDSDDIIAELEDEIDVIENSAEETVVEETTDETAEEIIEEAEEVIEEEIPEADEEDDDE
ncbi:MAG: DivIVA domain-containing protein, partial [Acutalibacteraceae bacterium]|nr:DivIVA domain-containing protein [Acutalibacteraceae bacterium]